MRSSSGCGTDDCGRTSAKYRPSTTLSPPSIRPSDARGRRSSAFVHEDSGRASGSALLVAVLAPARWVPWRSPMTARRTNVAPIRQTLRRSVGSAASQLRGDLEAEGPRLARRDVVVAIRRGPIALVEDVLDIELRLPGRVDLRIDAGVEAQEARQVDAVVGRRIRIREVDGAERGRPDRIDLILVPPRELMERNELNAVANDR